MVEKFTPEINKVYFINKYSLFHILAGTGSIQVDFKNYNNWQDKAIYLEKGQYIKFISDDFVVRKIEFPDEILFRNNDIRVLFKHLISLGYINFDSCEDCQRYLSGAVFSEGGKDIIDISSEHWFWQNPFQANRDEYQVIFDLKDVIDSEFTNGLSSKDLTSLLDARGHDIQVLVKDKIGLTVKGLYSSKKLIESKREVAFTDKNIQEISYELGYDDPGYFNRVFKKETGMSPGTFREAFDFKQRDRFVQDLVELLRTYHTKNRSLGFYADKMNVSVKILSRNVSQKMNTSLGKLIRYELLGTAEDLLGQGATVKDVSIRLGFEEANHFSTFFKHHKGITPSEYINKKSNK